VAVFLVYNPPVIAEILFAATMWQSDPPMPVPRSEVAGARWRGYVAVAGGFLGDGQSSARVDLYNARAREWERLPDLPVAVNHAIGRGGRSAALRSRGLQQYRRAA
jgi:Galactose oxidase, central domain